MIKTISAIILALTLLVTSVFSCFAAQAGIITPESTEVGLRMKLLVDKYFALSVKDMNNEIDKYKDVSTHWSKNYVGKLSALGIINGYGNGLFGVNDQLTGGQFVILLVRTLGFKVVEPTGSNYWQPYVDIATQEGVLKKGEVKDFTKPITRELTASLIRRAIGLYEEVPHDYFVKGTDYEGKGQYGFFDNVYVGYQKTKMADWSTISDTNLQAVLDCYRMGLLQGSNSKFVPKGYLTRGEAATIVTRLLDKSERHESIPTASESFKYVSPITSDLANGNCDEEWQTYSNKEYLLYRGYFPLMELWDTAKVINDNLNKINGGAYTYMFTERLKGIGIGWYTTPELEKSSRLYNDGTIVPQCGLVMNTDKCFIPKGQEYSIYDNDQGFLYSIDTNLDCAKYYDQALKPLTYEVMKVWFGAEYEKAKALHDKYLSIALDDKPVEFKVYMLNGRQVYFAGGDNSFKMEVWAKDVITKETMFKFN